MNLNLTPQQFLALYNSLSYQLDSTSSDTPGWGPVNQIRNAMNDVILDSLTSSETSRVQEKYGVWLEREQNKINHLKKELEDLKIHRVPEPDDGLFAKPNTQQTPRKSTKTA